MFQKVGRKSILIILNNRYTSISCQSIVYLVLFPYSQTTMYLLTSSIIISPGLVNYVLVIISVKLFNVVIALNYCMVQALGMITHFSSWADRDPFPSSLPLYRPVLLFCTMFTEIKYYIKIRKSVCTTKNYTVNLKQLLKLWALLCLPLSSFQ